MFGKCVSQDRRQGRLKVPTEFRRYIEERWRRPVLTSVLGDSALVYPAVWEERESRSRDALHRSGEEPLPRRVSYYGRRRSSTQAAWIPQILREAAGGGRREW
jgi:hypothetical protein